MRSPCAQVENLTGDLTHEIAEVKSFASQPDASTYPGIQPLLFSEKVSEVVSEMLNEVGLINKVNHCEPFVL